MKLFLRDKVPSNYNRATWLDIVSQVERQVNDLSEGRVSAYHGKASAAPTIGEWVRGDWVKNSLPSSSGLFGWICTESGSPGTWLGFGLIEPFGGGGGISLPIGAQNVTFSQSGIGAISTTVQEKLVRDYVSPLDYMTEAERADVIGLSPVNDHTSAILSACAAAVAQGKGVDFGGYTWLLKTVLALTSAHPGLHWVLRGATIKKGFSGNLITVTNAPRFRVEGAGTFDGQHGAFTGKGIVFSGSGSSEPLFGPGIIFDNFTDSHLEFGADAGRYVKVFCDFQPGSGQTDYRAVHITGTDTSAAHRHFSDVTAVSGYFDFDGALDTFTNNCAVRRMEIDSTCTIVNIHGGIWGNEGTAMTVSGGHVNITAVRFAGSVTLDANFSGVFTSPRFTSGKLINLSPLGVVVGDRQPRVIVANDYTETSVGATTNETALATIDIPGGLLRTADRMEVTAEFLWTDNGNSKTPRIRFGADGAGLSGTVGFSHAASTTNSGAVKLIIQNKDALNAQSLFGTVITSSGALVTNVTSSAIDTSADSEIVISGQKGDAGDTLTLISYTVELIRTP